MKESLQNTSNISSEDFSNLSCINELNMGTKKDPYIGTPFYTLKCTGSRKKGAEIEKIYQEVLESAGYKVRKPRTSEYDRLIQKDGKTLKVEIKGSFGWLDKEGKITHFRWQQIRDQDYDIVAFIAIYPERVELYYAKKEDVMAYVGRQNPNGSYPHNQHGGKWADSGTYLLDGFPSDFPFMKPHDGVLSNA